VPGLEIELEIDTIAISWLRLTASSWPAEILVHLGGGLT